MAISTPSLKAIARRVYSHLKKVGKKPRPTARAIERLLEVAWLASLRTEEGRPTVGSLTYVDPSNPDPEPPPVIRLPRPSYFPLAAPLPLTVRNLAKLAPALNPYTANIAVFSPVSGEPQISGFVDQMTLFRRSMDFESSEGRWQRPGLFQIDILGVGSFAVFDDDALIAAVRHDQVIHETLDVFHTGPVAGKLRALLAFRHISGKRVAERKRRSMRASLLCLARLLLRMQRFHHGGAILLDDGAPPSMLKLHRQVEYPKMGACVRELVDFGMAREKFDAVAWGRTEEAEAKRLDAHESLFVAGWRSEDASEALLGAIGLVASLTRVDGLVLIGPDLVVKGFAGEITCAQDPPRISVARSATATMAALREVSPSAFGTRHRSMLRYCWQRPGCVGFVVSQDGDIRAMTRIDDRVVIWENVRVQAVEPAKAAVAQHQRSNEARRRIARMRRRREKKTHSTPSPRTDGL